MLDGSGSSWELVWCSGWEEGGGKNGRVKLDSVMQRWKKRVEGLSRWLRVCVRGSDGGGESEWSG